MGTFMRNSLTAYAESVIIEADLNSLPEESPVTDWSEDGVSVEFQAGDDWDEDDDSFEDDDEEEFFEDDDEEFEDDDDEEEDDDFDDDADD